MQGGVVERLKAVFKCQSVAARLRVPTTIQQSAAAVAMRRPHFRGGISGGVLISILGIVHSTRNMHRPITNG